MAYNQIIETTNQKETDMNLEPLMQRIVELADEVPCRIAYLKDVTGASEVAIRRALLVLVRRGRLKKRVIELYEAAPAAE